MTLLPRAGSLQKACTFGVGHTLTGAAPVLPKDHGIEMNGTERDHRPAVVATNEIFQRVGCEVIQVFRHDITVASSQQSGRQRPNVRDQDKAMSARLKQLLRFREELAWFREVFQYCPEGDGVKLLPSEIMLQEGSAQHGNSAALRVVKRRTGDVGADALVAAGITGRQ